MKRYLTSIAYLFSLHTGCLIIFSLFRFILFISNHNLLQPESSGEWKLQAQAFLRGIWFDNVTACYIMLTPLAIATICSLFNYYGKRLYRFLTGFIITFYLISFALAAANIPYFHYFFKNINSSVLNWMDYGTTTIGMVLGEPSYWLALSGFTCVLALCIYGIRKYFKQFILFLRKQPATKGISLQTGGIFILGGILIGLCLFGIRGRRGYNPIKVSSAYYCNDPFLNQLGLNAAYNLLVTSLDDMRPENKRLKLTDEQKAVEYVKAYLKIPEKQKDEALVRTITAKGRTNKKNVIMIFMESMSADLIGAYEGEKSLTPFLDSLYQQSMSFKNIYSAGIHTNHGLYSTLYSFPTILKRNAMKGSDIPAYTGLPSILENNGYHNLFFMTHEAQYDNMNAFLRTNGYHDIYSEENYPEEKIVNSFGVPDDYLFEYALPVINRQAEKKQPFFATLLTISNHPPYIIPEWFEGKSQEKEDLIVEYADHCLKQFMQQAARQSWFENTLFVFLGDHGKMVGNPETQMPDSYNHIPLMIYYPGISPEENHKPGGQIDIAPTLLGMLNLNYRRHHLGIDLLKEERDCIFYTADNLIGCRDAEHLYIYAPGEDMEFRYLIDENGEFIPANNHSGERFEYLRKHCFSMLQATEYLVKERKTKL
ncbi:MAG: LTA synthase family protein [Bacteroidales bacterium]